jgi:type II secretory pathway predicted ATPase ExeA
MAIVVIRTLQNFSVRQGEILEMNYHSFFGFSDSPFLDDPDQGRPFLSKQFEQFLAELTDFVRQRQGIAVISGDDGVGKTMLIQALLHKIFPSSHPLIITRPPAEPLAITLMLAQSLDITLRHRNLVNLTPLAEALLEAAQKEKYVLLVLDDAHLLTDQHLEEIYVLSQMEHQGRQLMPIILAGRKGLVQKLASQTNQRLQGLIRHHLALTGLTFEETTQYISHRLQQVGSSYKACFAEGCSGQIFSRTGGIPRRINQVCDQALTRAWQEHQSRVTRDLIGEESPASPYKPLTPPPQSSFLTRFGAWAAAVLMTGLVGYVIYNKYATPPLATSPPVADRAALPSEIVPAPQPEQSSPTPETFTQTQPQEQKMEVAAAPPEPALPEPQTSQEPEPPEPQTLQEAKPPPVLPQAESAAVPQPETQAAETETSRPDTHRVVPEDGGLLRIVAGYYPDEQEIGYNAIILANPQIDNEDIIYPGQKLSLPEIDKHNNIITLNNNQHYSMYRSCFTASQVELTTARLQERELPYLVRKTRLPDAGPIYRIYVGGYESKEELKAAMASAARN